MGTSPQRGVIFLSSVAALWGLMILQQQQQQRQHQQTLLLEAIRLRCFDPNAAASSSSRIVSQRRAEATNRFRHDKRLLQRRSTQFSSTNAPRSRVPRSRVGADDADLLDSKLTEQIVEVTDDISVCLLEAGEAMQENMVEEAMETNDKLSSPKSDPYGAVLWPAALVASRRLLQLIESLKNDGAHGSKKEAISVLELGSGTGLSTLAAALKGSPVLATDFQPVTLDILNKAVSLNAIKRNLNASLVETALFDFSDMTKALPEGDIVVAADVLYYKETAEALAARCVEASRRGSWVIVADKDRPARPTFLSELRRKGIHNPAFMNVTGKACVGHRNWVIAEENALPKDIIVVSISRYK
eukprot:jgi/Bigna1/136763/aug1.35_g11471